MKLSLTTALSLAAAVANALPAEPQFEARGTPSNAPVTFDNLPGSSESFICGGKTYTGHQIYTSAQRGVALQEIGETRGRNSYPHPFDKDDSKGHHLSFLSGCPADTDRMEFPLMASPYDGGKNNVKQGDERVVYYYKPGEVDNNGDAKAIFCGIMTHVGAPPGGFLMC